jgi:hypothetical protein
MKRLFRLNDRSTLTKYKGSQRKEKETIDISNLISQSKILLLNRHPTIVGINNKNIEESYIPKFYIA